MEQMSTPNYSMALFSRYGHSGAMLATRITANIMRLREAKGWSRPQLGNRLTPPTSGQQIEKLEKGERRLTVDWIERVAKALNVDAAELIASQGETFNLTPQVADEVARTLAEIALQGDEPNQEIVQVLSLVLQELSATFSRHPAARRDPEVARPVIDLLAHRFAL